jgi:type I restriction enzyme S subunit
LGELLAKIEAGSSPKAEGRPAGPNEKGVLKVSAVSWGDFRPWENKTLPADYPFDINAAVRNGDLLISRANTSQLVGTVVLVDGDHPNLMLSDKTLRLVPASSEISKRFLLYALRTPWVRSVFEEDATGTSDSMRNLSQEKVRSAPIALPPREAQHRIIAKLESLQARSRRTKEALGNIPTLLEHFRQSVLDAAFRGDLTASWRAQHRSAESAVQLLAPNAL